ncbi:GNAT family N-acetyltransferase [Jatrophihabitans sp. YIM 134969]
MSDWNARVVAAAADWLYLPDGAPSHVTPEVAVVGYPESWDPPTWATRIRSQRAPSELIADVDAVVRAWGRPDVAWWIDEGTTPAELESHLQDAGAELTETVTVLALDLTGPVPAFDVPDGTTAALATDRDSLRDFARVNAEGWGTPVAPEDDLDRWLAETADGTGLRFVARADGTPVATGGMTLAGDVARLWAGVTLPGHRGRGAYRAVLAERLRVARERGATTGLVKGKVTTSAPILRRLGFQAFADERAYLRPVSG